MSESHSDQSKKCSVGGLYQWQVMSAYMQRYIFTDTRAVSKNPHYTWGFTLDSSAMQRTASTSAALSAELQTLQNSSRPKLQKACGVPTQNLSLTNTTNTDNACFLHGPGLFLSSANQCILGLCSGLFYLEKLS